MNRWSIVYDAGDLVERLYANRIEFRYANAMRELNERYIEKPTHLVDIPGAAEEYAKYDPGSLSF